MIFLDIGLPVMNGYDVARTLRECPEFERVHIAAVTGWGQDEDRRKAREAGFDSHFTKPLSPAVLEEVLATIAHAPACSDATTAALREPAAPIRVPPSDPSPGSPHCAGLCVSRPYGPRPTHRPEGILSTGDNLDLSRIGIIFRIRKTAAESGGRSFEMEMDLLPGSGGLSPAHPSISGGNVQSPSRHVRGERRRRMGNGRSGG